MSEVSEKLQGVIDTVKELTVVELVELVEALKGELGLSDADLQGSAGVVMAGPGGAGAEEAEEPTEFNVVLTSDGGNKIQAIKVVRAVSGLGLAEAKKFVEGVPQNVKEGIEKAEAEELAKQFEDIGAKVEIKPA